MKIIVIGKDFEPGKPIKEYAEKRLSKLEKISDAPIKEVRVLCKVYKEYQKVEITVVGFKTPVRSETKDQDIYAAIDLSVDKLVRQINKIKNKRVGKTKAKGVKEVEPEIIHVEEDVEYTPELVRIKEVTLEPITIDEAAFRMEMVGHPFYLFIHEETGKPAVLYRREDGNLAVITSK